MIVEVETPRGNTARFKVRPDTNDANLVYSILSGPGGMSDEYGLAPLHLFGWAIDVGAHIGAVTVAVLLDNPALTVIACEPVEENYLLLKENLELNGIGNERFIAFPCAAGVHGWIEMTHGYTEWGDHHPDYVKAHRFIGNQYRHEGGVTVPVWSWSLEDLVRLTPYGTVDFMKVDCEGCEWELLDSPAVSAVNMIRGELHCGYQGDYDPAWKGQPEEPGCHRCPDQNAHLLRMLGSTHDVDFSDAPFEMFTALRRS